jgi:hypothetical protein
MAKTKEFHENRAEQPKYVIRQWRTKEMKIILQ